MSEGLLKGHARQLVALTAAAGIMVATCHFTEEAPEEYLKNRAVPEDWIPDTAYDWITPEPVSASYIERVQVGRGQISSDTYRGVITTYVEAKAKFNAKINLPLVDITYDSTKALKEGMVVNRIKLPGIPLLDTLTFSDGTLQVTQFMDGKDVGIDISQAEFEKLWPEIALDENGELSCVHGPEDKDFSGCITSDIQNSSFLNKIGKLGSDHQNQIRNAVNTVLDEYGKIEKCHFDTIIIPAMNKVYEKYGLPLIEGDTQYTQAMATLLRGFWRDGIKSSTPPQVVTFNIVGEYEPLESIMERFVILENTVNFPFSVPDNYTREDCAKGPDNVIPLEFGKMAGGLVKDISYLAIMGLETVPEDYDPIRKAFGDRKPVDEEILEEAA